MSPSTQTRPLDDKTMWRKLLARAHPDAGGSGELFVWCGAVKDAVCGGELRIEPKPQPAEQPPHRREASTDDKPRVPYPERVGFAAVTRSVLGFADSVEPAYARLLSLLVDCYPLEHLAYEEERGASYKSLAAIAYAAGMSATERSGWYRVAEAAPLADRHAGHILSKLKRERAA